MATLIDWLRFWEWDPVQRDVARTVTTFLALFVGAVYFWFKEVRWAWARLGIRRDMARPALSREIARDGAGRETKVLCVRLCVSNTGYAAAEKAEVVLSDLHIKAEEGGAWIPIDMLPTPLLWTHYGTPQLEVIVPHSDRYVDLAWIDPTAVHFQISPRPNEMYTPYRGHTYCFSVTVGAIRAKPDKATLHSHSS